MHSAWKLEWGNMGGSVEMEECVKSWLVDESPDRRRPWQVRCSCEVQRWTCQCLETRCGEHVGMADPQYRNPFWS